MNWVSIKQITILSMLPGADPMPLVIHIGFGKTGTTSIQEYCHNYRIHLENSGWLYPFVGLRGSGHHEFAPLGAQDLSPAVVDYINQLILLASSNPDKSILISSEFFIFMHRRCVEQLGYLLRTLDVVILFYIREQVSLIESTFLEWQKTGSDYCAGEIKSFFERHKQSFDFCRLLEPWEAVFGSNRIKVRLYHKDINGSNVVPDFLLFAGIGHVGSSNIQILANPSIHPEFSKLVSLIDAHPHPTSERHDIIKEILRLSILIKPLSRVTLVDDVLRDEISQFYRVSNQIISEKYLSVAEAALFKQ